MYKDLENIVISYLGLEEHLKLYQTDQFYKYQKPNINDVICKNEILSLHLLISLNIGITSRTLDLLAKYGFINELIFLMNKGYKPSRDSINWATETGKLEIVKFLIDSNIPTSSNTFYICAKYGHLKILRYFLEKRLLSLPININIADTATISGHYDIIRYLYAIYKIKPTVLAVDMACKYGHINIIKYWYKHDIKPSKAGLEQAVKFKNLEIISFLKSKKYKFTTLAVQYAKDNKIYDDLFKK